MGLNGPGPKRTFCLLQRRTFQTSSSGGFITCRRRLSLSPSSCLAHSQLSASPFRSRLCGYTPGEGTVTGTGGGPPTRSRGGDGFLAASGASSWPALWPLGSFGESSSWGPAGSSSSSSQSRWGVGIGRVLLSLRMLTVTICFQLVRPRRFLILILVERRFSGELITDSSFRSE
ncbi:hypothetical protein PVAP13_8NG276400 [Panicum virgatum]|uniref:Uncharacterized protein n=1 Tax=Panicum virgatum TaxID=38727 RepID=A0A8T0PAD1_PANVG|nr:hypothetical protein PVAP13_8NG276400 [Panicum virgatum]